LSGDNFEADRGRTITCEALGCTANATRKIAIKVGTLGIISIFVCSDCVPIFQEPIAKCESAQPQAEKSLESQNKEKNVLVRVGGPGSNTIPRNQLQWTVRNKEDDCKL
jgi:hypothetical protein